MVHFLKELGNEQLMGNLFVDLLQAFAQLRRREVSREVAGSSQELGQNHDRYLLAAVSTVS